MMYIIIIVLKLNYTPLHVFVTTALTRVTKLLKVTKLITDSKLFYLL